MNVIKNILKIAGAGIVAVALLSGIFAFYYLQPAHIDNTQGNTDYVWIANSRWLKMTEGISWGRFDADGYNNKAVVENPDIMVLGSSHTEATNVPQGSDFSSLLGEKLAGEFSVYNCYYELVHITFLLFRNLTARGGASVSLRPCICEQALLDYCGYSRQRHCECDTATEKVELQRVTDSREHRVLKVCGDKRHRNALIYLVKAEKALVA